MPTRRPGETVSQFAIRTAWETGHFFSPANPDGLNVKETDLLNLAIDDPVVVQALISYSKFDASRYTKHVLDVHGRQPNFDGQLGPAMERMVLDSGRCPVPDFAPPPGVVCTFSDPDLQKVVDRMQKNATLPAVGSGSWPNCSGITGFHAANISVNTAGVPTFLKPVFIQVLKNVQMAYAGIGLLFRFYGPDGKDLLTGTGMAGSVNSDMSFVNSSDGWIGLAIVGQNESCSSKIWCKFLGTYQGGSTPEAITAQWTTLIKHELGHNCGRGHTSGGVMNPSIVNSLPTMWTDNDPSTSWLKGQFGGVPVQIPGGGPPPQPPNPPQTLEQRMLALEIKDIVQSVTLQWCVEKIKVLGG